MSLAKKLLWKNRKGYQYQFDVSVHYIENLPPKFKMVQASFSRGAKLATTKPVFVTLDDSVDPATAATGGICRADWDASGHLTWVSTLFKVEGTTKDAFESKEYRLSIKKVKDGNAGTRLVGSVMVDFADYARIEGECTEQFIIPIAGYDPAEITVTIKSSWLKGNSGGEGSNSGSINTGSLSACSEQSDGYPDMDANDDQDSQDEVELFEPMSARRLSSSSSLSVDSPMLASAISPSCNDSPNVSFHEALPPACSSATQTNASSPQRAGSAVSPPLSTNFTYSPESRLKESNSSDLNAVRDSSADAALVQLKMMEAENLALQEEVRGLHKRMSASFGSRRKVVSLQNELAEQAEAHAAEVGALQAEIAFLKSQVGVVNTASPTGTAPNNILSPLSVERSHLNGPPSAGHRRQVSDVSEADSLNTSICTVVHSLSEADEADNAQQAAVYEEQLTLKDEHMRRVLTAAGYDEAAAEALRSGNGDGVNAGTTAVVELLSDLQAQLAHQRNEVKQLTTTLREKDERLLAAQQSTSSNDALRTATLLAEKEKDYQTLRTTVATLTSKLEALEKEKAALQWEQSTLLSLKWGEATVNASSVEQLEAQLHALEQELVAAKVAHAQAAGDKMEAERALANARQTIETLRERLTQMEVKLAHAKRFGRKKKDKDSAVPSPKSPK